MSEGGTCMFSTERLFLNARYVWHLTSLTGPTLSGSYFKPILSIGQ